MSRQKCCRKVGLVPRATRYRPEGKGRPADEDVVLSLDEFEAIRLADYAGLYQEEAARRMSVSRQTFGRIIESAHTKIADVLINGKSLTIQGGNVSLDDACPARCAACATPAECRPGVVEGYCPRLAKEQA